MVTLPVFPCLFPPWSCRTCCQEMFIDKANAVDRLWTGCGHSLILHVILHIYLNSSCLLSTWLYFAIAILPRVFIPFYSARQLLPLNALGLHLRASDPKGCALAKLTINLDQNTSVAGCCGGHRRWLGRFSCRGFNGASKGLPWIWMVLNSESVRKSLPFILQQFKCTLKQDCVCHGAVGSLPTASTAANNHCV